MDNNTMVQRMTEAANLCGARRLCLFGSRARGDYRANSDYDFAAWGVPDEMKAKLLDMIEDFPSLEKIDCIFINENTDQNLLTSIWKDGVVLIDKFETKFSNYEKALERLKEGLSQYSNLPNSIIRDGVIQRFEFTSELAWKTAREFLLDQQYADINSPKAVMKKAWEHGLISGNDGWISLLADRNLTSHMYDEATAEEILNRIKNNHLNLLLELAVKMKSR